MDISSAIRCILSLRKVLHVCIYYHLDSLATNISVYIYNMRHVLTLEETEGGRGQRDVIERRKFGLARLYNQIRARDKTHTTGKKLVCIYTYTSNCLVERVVERAGRNFRFSLRAQRLARAADFTLAFIATFVSRLQYIDIYIHSVQRSGERCAVSDYDNKLRSDSKVRVYIMKPYRIRGLACSTHTHTFYQL